MNAHTTSRPFLFENPIISGVLSLAVGLTFAAVAATSLISARNVKNATSVVARGEVMYVPDLRMTRFMGLGYDQAAADFLWLRTINYFTRHFTGDRQYTWLEHLLDQIITLDPKFRRVYHWAGTNVLYGQAFNNENALRSSRFYELALKHFPDDAEAAYRLGLNYYIEMHGKTPEEDREFKEKGLSYLELAANIPNSPPNIQNLVASISTRMGKSQVALQYYIDLYIRSDDEVEREVLASRIEKMRKESTQGEDFALEAIDFQKRWRDEFPYLTPTLFTFVNQGSRGDVDWHSLIPDIALGNAQ